MESARPSRPTRATLSVGLASSSSGHESSCEFQEEEIVFADEEGGEEDEDEESIRAAEPRREGSIGGAGKVAGSSLRTGFGERRRQSAPVNIPPWPRTGNSKGFTVEEYDEEEEEEGESRRAAPHELLDRMKSNFMTFSVCEGFGRTLKGRDLSQVRNAVLRQTGFLD